MYVLIWREFSSALIKYSPVDLPMAAASSTYCPFSVASSLIVLESLAFSYQSFSFTDRANVGVNRYYRVSSVVNDSVPFLPFLTRLR